jgi:hypothetical protein
MSAQEDFEVIQKDHELSQAFIAAKATRGQEGHDEDAVNAASAALSEYRTYWRGIREFLAAVREQEWAAAQEQTETD